MIRFSRENWLLLECRRGAWYCCDGGERAGFPRRAAGLRCGTEAQARVGAGGWSWRVCMSAGAGGRGRGRAGRAPGPGARGCALLVLRPSPYSAPSGSGLQMGLGPWALV